MKKKEKKKKDKPVYINKHGQNFTMWQSDQLLKIFI